MREIKFRGKRLNNDPQTGPADGWVTGFYYQDLCGGKIRHFITSCPCVWEVDPDTVGQYTGLHDNNDTEIYEGDIFEGKNTGWRAMVQWDNANARFVGRRLDGNIISLLGKPFVEIIGNIHDNPELMKGGEQ